jgi:hypothetical protein
MKILNFKANEPLSKILDDIRGKVKVKQKKRALDCIGPDFLLVSFTKSI